MKIPNKAIVAISGFVMLGSVEGGREYRIEHGAPHNNRETYAFYRPRGKKAIIRHYVSDVDPFVVEQGATENKVVSQWNKITIKSA